MDHATYIALLRGINITGHRAIKMAALRAHFEAWGAKDVRTYIQSGNVVFTHRQAQPAALRKSLENHLAASLGYSVPTLVKSAQELAAIAKANPFPPKVLASGNRVYVCFFEQAPAAQAIANIQPYVTRDEQLLLKGAAGYAYYANGLGRAKLTSALIERKLGLATLRNWNTVNALLELASA